MSSKFGLVALAGFIMLTPQLAAGEDEYLKQWREDCEAGDANSCSNYGSSLDDREKSLFYYRKACDAGAEVGCYNIAGMFMAPDASDEEKAQVGTFLGKSCELGGTNACERLAGFYVTGDYVEKDAGKALVLFRKVCEFGQRDSCYNAGALLAAGDGVDKDVKGAIRLFDAACLRQQGKACAALAEIYGNGLDVEADADRASEYRAKACEGGEAEICNALAELSETGAEGEQNTAVAIKFYRESCSWANEEGCTNLKRLVPPSECPCFSKAEIDAACPRPTADATTRLISMADGGRSLECYTTVNYSPGSIKYEVFPAQSADQKPECGIQSVSSDETPIGKYFGLYLTSDWMAACIRTMDDLAAKPGVERVSQ